MSLLRLKEKLIARETGPGRKSYRHTVSLVKKHLKPLQPRGEFSQRLREMCSALDMERIFLEAERRGSHRRRSLVLGGIFSTLPIFGLASYTLVRRHLRRKAAVAH